MTPFLTRKGVRLRKVVCIDRQACWQHKGPSREHGRELSDWRDRSRPIKKQQGENAMSSSMEKPRDVVGGVAVMAIGAGFLLFGQVFCNFRVIGSDMPDHAV